jgi:hypothetical protein
MDFYLLPFCLMPLIGMIAAIVIVARDKAAHRHQHHPGLRH